MSDASVLFVQAELSLAAYAILSPGVPDIDALQDEGRGMSLHQAQQFAENWLVVYQFNGALGVSATIFQSKQDGTLHLAIRGTQFELGDLLADMLLAVGVSIRLNEQYTSLQAQINAWLAGGPLSGKSFTVAGYSLGGYLAAAVKEQYSQVSEAYLYNAHGSGGLIGNIASLVSGLFSQTSPGTNNIWNIKASEGLSLIAGLGGQPAGSLPIQIEESGLDNHSIVVFTDALALQAVYAQLAPSLAQDELNVLSDASGGSMEQYALDALRRISTHYWAVMKKQIVMLCAVPLLVACSSGPLVKAVADAEVDRLCAIDGGVKVYETVALPSERFDKWGNIGVRIKENAAPTDDYYSDGETKFLREGHLTIVRFSSRIVRRSDAKVLGEAIQYGRGGGDVPGPWHPSGYECPPLSESIGKLQSSVFRKKDSK